MSVPELKNDGPTQEKREAAAELVPGMHQGEGAKGEFQLDGPAVKLK